MDIFCTPCQHPHLDQRKACHSSEPHSRGRLLPFLCGFEALRSLTWPFQQHPFTQISLILLFFHSLQTIAWPCILSERNRPCRCRQGRTSHVSQHWVSTHKWTLSHFLGLGRQRGPSVFTLQMRKCRPGEGSPSLENVGAEHDCLAAVCAFPKSPA